LVKNKTVGQSPDAVADRSQCQVRLGWRKGHCELFSRRITGVAATQVTAKARSDSAVTATAKRACARLGISLGESHPTLGGFEYPRCCMGKSQVGAALVLAATASLAAGCAPLPWTANSRAVG